MEYRVEKKYLVSDSELFLLGARLKTAMATDMHQKGDCYQIRSLYFDDIRDSCMTENDAGVDQRKKYRVRIYDPSALEARLEIKEKVRGLTKKTGCMISREECFRIMRNELPFLIDERMPLNLLQIQMRCAYMRPKAIISYERTAFVYPAGNVRVTFDKNITASRVIDSFYDPTVLSEVPVLPTGMHILEVKYDEMLPDFISNVLELGRLQQVAFSKYYLGRLAIRGEVAIQLR